MDQSPEGSGYVFREHLQGQPPSMGVLTVKKSEGAPKGVCHK